MGAGVIKLLFSFWFLFAAFIVFIAVYVTTNVSIRTFIEKSVRGKAEVLYFKRKTMYVRVLDLHDGVHRVCKHEGLKPKAYPKGLVVDVKYTRQKMFGKTVFDVHLANKPPNLTVLSLSSLYMALCCLLVSAILLFLTLFLI